MADYVSKDNAYLGDATSTQAPGCNFDINEALDKVNPLLQKTNVRYFYLTSKKARKQNSINGLYIIRL